ncbi:MAG: hypothetical protein LBP74_02315 [Treponema sp.]|nr:hypothetical protein [Treponema sp.]
MVKAILAPSGRYSRLLKNFYNSTNLERNLYFCLQFQELGIPVIGALNMSDEAESRGIFIDDK